MTSAAPLAALLVRAAAELVKSEARLTEVDHAISDLLASAAALSADRSAALQQIDRVRQDIGGIAEFLCALATAIPSEWTADPHAVTGALRLEGLANALRLGGAGEAEAGGVEVFS